MKTKNNKLTNLRYPDNYLLEIYQKIPKNSKVLDVGCNTGRLGEELKKNKNCFVFGIDISEDSLKIARERLDSVKKIDLEKYEKPFNEKFDVIVFADVLEHLRKPNKTIEIYKELLSNNGFIIASMPNIANIHIRLNLLLGKWNYQEEGILDKTHLRFFTRKSMIKLFKSKGYDAKIIDFTPGFNFIFFRYFRPLQKIRKFLCRIYPNLFAKQFIIYAKIKKTAFS